MNTYSGHDRGRVRQASFGAQHSVRKGLPTKREFMDLPKALAGGVAEGGLDGQRRALEREAGRDRAVVVRYDLCPGDDGVAGGALRAPVFQPDLQRHGAVLGVGGVVIRLDA